VSAQAFYNRVYTVFTVVNMPKNITLAISDDIANEMETMPEVNWSSVARTCITQYIELRKKPDIAPLLEKLQKQKGEEYVNGRKKADSIAEDLGYAGLNVLMKKYRKEDNETEEWRLMGQDPSRPWEVPPSPEDIMESLLIEKKLIDADANDAFIRGLTDRLFEIEKMLPR
jgi:hypothetical protein